MSNDDTNKFAGLKVPPLKIILNPTQSNSENNQSKAYHSAKLSTSKSIDLKISENGPSRSSNEPSSPSSSDRSTSSSPVTESESFASNSTTSNLDAKGRIAGVKDSPSYSRQPRAINSSLNRFKLAAAESGSEQSKTDPSSQTSSNQRITRSSQRALLNNSQDFASSNEESNPIEQNEKSEVVRKPKRRKYDAPEAEQQDPNQNNQPPPLPYMELRPEHYMPPLRNSFQLFSDMKRKLDAKMRGLKLVCPRVPPGFEEYLFNKGPYLLNGNKLGLGMTGSKSRETILQKVVNEHETYTNSGSRCLAQRHAAYSFPKKNEVPASLQKDSPLHQMFIDQEVIRHRLRKDQLKERERCIMAAEQEILRDYMQAALIDVNQLESLSACTLLYYQDNYHYPKEESKSRSSDLHQFSQSNEAVNDDIKSNGRDVNLNSDIKDSHEKVELKQNEELTTKDLNHSMSSILKSCQSQCIQSGTDDTEESIIDGKSMIMSDEDRDINRTTFLNNLQKTDDKWENIKNEMLKRHINESDSLHAIQTLEWEWKMKEIGACDVRNKPTFDDECVPKIVVNQLDY